MAAGGHGGGHGKRKRGGHHEEEHENHERWLVSYADMMTLLMALFLVMFAMSTIDKVKFEQLANGLADGFGKPAYVPLDGGDGVLQAGDSEVDPIPLEALTLSIPEIDPGNVDAQPVSDTGSTPPDLVAQAKAEAQRLREIAEAAEAGLVAVGLSGRADYRIDERGLVIALVADNILFRNGSAELETEGRLVIDAIAPVLRDVTVPLEVEGHANHLPLTGGALYPSNWELSAARAAGVARHLIEGNGLDAARLSATGYSDTRPVVDVDDPNAIARNRRVEVVVLSDESADVRALLPAVAGDLAPESA